MPWRCSRRIRDEGAVVNSRNSASPPSTASRRPRTARRREHGDADEPEPARGRLQAARTRRSATGCAGPPGSCRFEVNGMGPPVSSANSLAAAMLRPAWTSSRPHPSHVSGQGAGSGLVPDERQGRSRDAASRNLLPLKGLPMSTVAYPQDITTDDPELTLGMMSDLGEGELLDAWNSVLDIQTRGFGPREVQWLRDAGFGAGGRSVLEVGSARRQDGQVQAGDRGRASWRASFAGSCSTTRKFTSYFATYRFMKALAPQAPDPAVLAFLKGRLDGAAGILDGTSPRRNSWWATHRPSPTYSVIGYVYFPVEEHCYDWAERIPTFMPGSQRLRDLPGWRSPTTSCPAGSSSRSGDLASHSPRLLAIGGLIAMASAIGIGRLSIRRSCRRWRKDCISRRAKRA